VASRPEQGSCAGRGPPKSCCALLRALPDSTAVCTALCGKWRRVWASRTTNPLPSTRRNTKAPRGVSTLLGGMAQECLRGPDVPDPHLHVGREGVAEIVESHPWPPANADPGSSSPIGVGDLEPLGEAGPSQGGFERAAHVGPGGSRLRIDEDGGAPKPAGKALKLPGQDVVDGGWRAPRRSSCE
jgi:hypothetical protein